MVARSWPSGENFALRHGAAVPMEQGRAGPRVSEVPNLHDIVCSHTGQAQAIWRERRIIDSPKGPTKFSERTAIREIPDLKVTVSTAGHEFCSGGIKSQCANERV